MNEKMTCLSQKKIILKHQFGQCNQRWHGCDANDTGNGNDKARVRCIFVENARQTWNGSCCRTKRANQNDIAQKSCIAEIAAKNFHYDKNYQNVDKTAENKSDKTEFYDAPAVFFHFSNFEFGEQNTNQNHAYSSI